MSYDFLYGSAIGGAFLVFVYVLIIFLLSSQKLLTKNLFFVISFALLARTIAVNFYASSPSDSSVTFFPNATLVFNGVGEPFVYFFTGILKAIGFTTLLSQFYFCNALGFLGTYFYFKLYVQLAKNIKFTSREYHYSFAYCVIWLWPSFVFWTTGLVKDSGMFLALSMIFYGAICFRKHKVKALSLLVFGLSFVWLARPQIYAVLLGAILMLNFSSRKISMKMRIFIVGLLLIFIIWFLPVILRYGRVAEISDITSRGIQLQTFQSQGTAISVPTHDPVLMLFFLPYTMAANLFLPLFFGITNIMGVVASIENLFFLYLCYIYFKYRPIFIRLVSLSSSQLVKYIELYLLFGCGFLGMANTNLGLAMRQKTMYTGPFLVLLMLVMLLKRRDKIRQVNSVKVSK